jgi:hypothetical protein
VACYACLDRQQRAWQLLLLPVCCDVRLRWCRLPCLCGGGVGLIWSGVHARTSARSSSSSMRIVQHPRPLTMPCVCGSLAWQAPATSVCPSAQLLKGQLWSTTVSGQTNGQTPAAVRVDPGTTGEDVARYVRTRRYSQMYCWVPRLHRSLAADQQPGTTHSTTRSNHGTVKAVWLRTQALLVLREPAVLAMHV